MIYLYNNRVIGIHKGFNGKENVGTVLRELIEKFYEQSNKTNNIQINKDVNKNMEQKINVSKNNINERINDNNKDLNEITIQNKVGKFNAIKLFSKTFVENNQKICTIIICDKEYNLCEYWPKKNLQLDRIFEIRLKGIKNVTKMSYMFHDCSSSLSSLSDISKWDTKNITDMSYMFE